MKRKAISLIVLSFVLSGWVTASEQSVKFDNNAPLQSEVILSDNDEDLEDSLIYDFKISVGLGRYHEFYFGEVGLEEGIDASLSLDVEYKSFFIEDSNKKRIGGVLGRATPGYHLWQDDEQRIDVIGGYYIPGISTDDKNNDLIPELQNLKSRDESIDLGIRYGHFSEDWYFSSEIANDVVGLAHKGFILETYLGRVTSKGNWDIIYGVAHTWYSSKTTNYYVGLTEEEIVNDWESYKTRASYAIRLEFSAQYPLSENWVFESALTAIWLSKNLSKSPLIAQDNSLSVYIGFGYIF